MEKKVYKSYEDLPLMLTVPDVAAWWGGATLSPFSLCAMLWRWVFP